MLTILSWFWRQPRGRSNYTAESVNIWADMVRRHIKMPHRIACVTRETSGLDSRITVIDPPGDFENLQIPTWGETLPQCLRRLAMFRPDAGSIFGERFVNMDLDCVVNGQLDPLFDHQHTFMMARGTSRNRPYNGSMLMMTAGARPQVFTDFTIEGATEAGYRFLGSDQAWISHKLGKGEETWKEADGVFWYRNRPFMQGPECRVMFFPGLAKPWECVGTDAWITQHYHRDLKGGRCLVLGYGDAVWEDAGAAIETGPFDVVIASPEAAENWPSKVDFIVRSDHEANEFLRVNRFTEAVFCGRSEELAA